MFEFVGHATGMIHYEQVSLLNGLIDFFAWYRGKQYKLVGGLETLVHAFVKRLPGNIVRQAQVSAIEMTERVSGSTGMVYGGDKRRSLMPLSAPYQPPP